MKAFAGALRALALLAAGCTSPGITGRGGARVAEGDTVLMERDGGWRAAAVGDRLPERGRVRTGVSRARLEFAGGELWLGPSATVRLTGEVIELERGEIVVDSRRGLSARLGTAAVSGTAVYRMAPGASPRVGVYRGDVVVTRPGERRALPALRQLGLAARRLAAQPDPLFYVLDDPWDRALLPGAVAFDEEVAALARGIDREYGREPQPPEFYASFAAVTAEAVPLLASTARQSTPQGAFGPPSDALMTLFVAAAVAKAGGEPLQDALGQVATQRRRGARWGLIAVEAEIGTPELAAAVDLARERRETVAPRSATPGPRPTARPTGGPGPGPGPRPTPGPRPSPSPSPTPSPSPPPPDPQDVIEDTIEDILG
jgi:hypothetical protein